MTHYGRDYSSFQGNLTPADCAGIDFGYVKLTQGDEYKNPDAPQQIAMLRSQGVLVGYYHFFDPSALVGDQLHNFATMASACGVSPLPLALDSETQDTAGWPDLASKMMDFATGVEGWTNWVPNPRSLLYVNLNFYDNLQGFPWGRWVWLADPSAGAPHKPCLILQGAPRPVSSTDTKNVDPDTFMGSEADWATFTRATVPAPKLPQEKDMLIINPGDGKEYLLLPSGVVIWIEGPATAASLSAAQVPTVAMDAGTFAAIQAAQPQHISTSPA